MAKQLPALVVPVPAHGEPPEHGQEHMVVVAGHVFVAGSAAKHEMPSSCWQGWLPVHAQICVTADVGANVGLVVGPWEWACVGNLVGARVGKLVGNLVG